ncbi:hypothetical protein IEQ34_020431 [Dendrobium chrysotoxum]|uniref:Uncharacterized protein n=1 Tax=Dendrobium chrysotoxum TaxID=161865 RepID=A0AAV7G102_DENCH|nr:hypothetical protein IEQ34_020431 [Dendrobium chrysotoxum]
MGDITSTKIPPAKGDRPVVQSKDLKKSQKVAKADDVVSIITGNSLIIFRKKFHFPNDLILDEEYSFNMGLSTQAGRLHAHMLKKPTKVLEAVIQPSKAPPKRSENEGDP